ncbi:hypothetical protein A6770_22105 [Nostoc minutum NIES-26]|uniref:eCIS core domain-containing protein n=1 Tax=Nostoc minutum NIES-26 TaxID=1844469 RepID=A0A367QYZ7_9NOSO|nr:hypothetical protein A6770_22105 [Nostoc minutum NIES-26]
MSQRNAVHLQNLSQSTFLSIQTGQLQRQCAACGQHSIAGSECQECKKKQILQRRASHQGEISDEVPPIVHEVLTSPGQPLEASTRTFMESRFGHDFSRVRVHTDAKAAESALAVNALAYTVEQNVVFGKGQYAPVTTPGKKLLAHELTHVVQQSSLNATGGSAIPAEAEAERVSQQISKTGASSVKLSVPAGKLLRQPSPTNKNAIDKDAQAIIAIAQDQNRTLKERGITVVKEIIAKYYPSDASKVDSIVYEESETGLNTTSKGTGQNTKGIIKVGRYFVENTTKTGFARRVAQVGHEIEHINQYRTGMAGANRKDEREFLAFYHEALFVEKPGTGRIQHATRVTLIDAALGYYNCFNTTLQQQYDNQKQELLKRRQIEASQGGNQPSQPPTNCRRQT